jgi:hypothetical protein
MNETGASTRECTSWKTVAEAAAALGISERAVQRRCRKGKLRARLVPTPTGQAWQIEAASLESASTRSDDTFDDDTSDTNGATGPTLSTPATDETTRTTPQAATLPTDTTETAPTPPTSGDATPDTSDARYVAHLESENVFLRGLVEQRDRDAAELRAALRESLRAMPKQIEAREYSQDGKDTQEAKESGAAGIVSGTQKKAATSAPQRAPRPLWRVILGLR